VEETVTTTDDQTRREARRPAREIYLSVAGEVGFRNLWTLDPRSHSRLESLARKEARAGGLLPDPDPEWSRMLPVVPEEVRHDTSDGCPSCGSGIEKNARHVLFECVRFVEDRKQLELIILVRLR